MPVKEVTTRARSLRLVESFHADQVEGPIRLFDEQFMLAPSLESERTYRMTLAVSRYAQIQHWNIDALTQDGVSVRYEDEGLIDADRGMTDTFQGVDIPHTREALAEDPIPSAGHDWPRSRSCRVPGGYVVVHGYVGRASRHIIYPEELA